jgi:flagellar biosynthesis GTPase FlhF
MAAMVASYDDAVVALYRARHDAFVAERKRLSAELKAGGDKAGATRLAKLGRPPVSAWAVNQLWWQERQSFDELLRAAERPREGDRGASVAHREALARLRARAAAVLVEAGHAANEATLRRVTTTLSAVAATGSFDPDPPGALVGDRDPPGFDAVGLTAPVREAHAAVEEPAPNAAEKNLEDEAQARARAQAGERQKKDEERARSEAAERQKKDEERARSEATERQKDEERARSEAAERRRMEEKLVREQAERTRLDVALRSTKSEVDALTREVERLRGALQRAEASLEQAGTKLEDLEKRRASL